MRIWKTFDKLSEAKAWRAEATTKVRKGELAAPTKVTLAEAADHFLTGAKDGSIRRKDGRPYAPSTVRTYEAPCGSGCCPNSDTCGYRRSPAPT